MQLEDLSENRLYIVVVCIVVILFCLGILCGYSLHKMQYDLTEEVLEHNKCVSQNQNTLWVLPELEFFNNSNLK